MRNNNEVFRTLALVSQFGFSMLTPIALCTFLGVWLHEKFSFSVLLVIPLFVLGAAAGFRNCYILAKSVNKKDRKSEDKKKGT